MVQTEGDRGMGASVSRFEVVVSNMVGLGEIERCGGRGHDRSPSVSRDVTSRAIELHKYPGS